MALQSRLTGAAALMVAQAMVLVLGYVTHLWIGRVLGPEPYGVYGLVLSVQSIFGLLLTLGVPVAVSRFVAQDERHAQAILRQGMRYQLMIAVVVGMGLSLASPLLAYLLGDRSLVPYLLFSAAVIFTQAFYPLFSQFLAGMHRFNRQALLTGLYAFVKLLGALALIYVFEVYGALAGFAIGGIVAALFGWWWTYRVGGAVPITLSSRSFLSFAGTFVLILVGLQLLISLDLFMVKGLLRSDVETGYYNAAVTLSRIPYMLLQSLGFVLLPSVAKLTAPGESRNEAARFISDTIRYLIALIVPSVALAAATSKTLLRVFYSHEYLPAAAALTILMVGLGALAFYLLLATIVAGAGRARVGLFLTVVLVGISGVSGWFLIPRFGLVGAAWQTTLAGVVGLLLLSAYTFKTFRIPVPFLSTLNILIASAIAIAPTYVWHPQPLTIVPLYLCSGVLYVFILWVLREIRPMDRLRVAQLHPRLAWLAPSSRAQS